MSSRAEVLKHAVEVLQAGETLTLDSVARRSGLSKPGVVHHFTTKDGLVVAVIEYVVDRWEVDLRSRAREDETPLGRLRSYVDFALTGTFDASDLALLADSRLRERIRDLWLERLDPWLGWDIPGTPERRARLRAARLLADGVWLNSALDIPTVLDDERADLHALALDLINEGNTEL